MVNYAGVLALILLASIHVLPRIGNGVNRFFASEARYWQTSKHKLHVRNLSPQPAPPVLHVPRPHYPVIWTTPHPKKGDSPT